MARKPSAGKKVASTVKAKAKAPKVAVPKTFNAPASPKGANIKVKAPKAPKASTMNLFTPSDDTMKMTTTKTKKKMTANKAKALAKKSLALEK